MKISSTIINKAIAKNGKHHQSVKATEECGELIQAISKCLTDGEDKRNKKHLTEEIADVYIILDELRIMYNVDSNEIQEVIMKKLERLEKILEKGRKKMEVKLIDESCIEEIEKEGYRENKYYYAGVMNVLSIIKKSPVRKDVKFRLFNNQYENVYRCDECNADFHSYGKISYKYCPYCGSKVLGVQKLDNE